MENEADGLHTVESVEHINKSLSHTLSKRGRKPRGAAGVQFQDQQLRTEFELGASQPTSMASEDDVGNTAEIMRQASRTSQEKRKLVIIMVGLPGRGKTYLCNKLMCYLNWCVDRAVRVVCLSWDYKMSSAVHVQPVARVGVPPGCSTPHHIKALIRSDLSLQAWSYC